MLFKVGDKMIGFLEDSHKINVTLKLIFDISTTDSTIQQIEVCSSNVNIEWSIKFFFQQRYNARIIILLVPPSPVNILINFWCKVSIPYGSTS